jgi:hypothetical protein
MDKTLGNRKSVWNEKFEMMTEKTVLEDFVPTSAFI